MQTCITQQLQSTQQRHTSVNVGNGGCRAICIILPSITHGCLAAACMHTAALMTATPRRPEGTRMVPQCTHGYHSCHGYCEGPGEAQAHLLSSARRGVGGGVAAASSGQPIIRGRHGDDMSTTQRMQETHNPGRWRGPPARQLCFHAAAAAAGSASRSLRRGAHGPAGRPGSCAARTCGLPSPVAMAPKG